MRTYIEGENTRVCLVYPTIYEPPALYAPPLGLVCLAAVLEEAGHDVKVIDREVILHHSKMNWQEVNRLTKDILAKYNPEIIGISATSPLIPDAYHVARLAKNVVPEALVVVGGPYPTALPKLTLEGSKDIDVAAMGEGEVTILELAAKKKLKEIRGICFREKGRIYKTEPRIPYPNIDELPYPARHLLDMDAYTHPTFALIRGMYLKVTSLQTARGCPFNCTFCFNREKRVRFHSPEYVVGEIENIINNFKVEGFFLVDDIFTLNKKRAKKICELIITKGLHKKIVWSAQARVDTINREVLEAMKRAGCVQVEYGFESGSQRILDLTKKGTTVEQNVRTAKITKETGLRVLANIMVGLPNETKEDIEKSRQLLKKTKPDFIAINKLYPVPGSELYDTLEKKDQVNNNWFLDRSYDWLLNKNFTDMSDREFEIVYQNFHDEYRVHNFLGYLRASPLGAMKFFLTTKRHAKTRTRMLKRNLPLITG